MTKIKVKNLFTVITMCISCTDGMCSSRLPTYGSMLPEQEQTMWSVIRESGSISPSSDFLPLFIPESTPLTQAHSQVDPLEEQFNQMCQRVETQAKEIEGLKETVTSLSQSVSDLMFSVEQQKNGGTVLPSSITDLGRRFDVIAGTVTKLERDLKTTMESLKQELREKADQWRLKEISTSLWKNKTPFSLFQELQEVVGGLQEKVEDLREKLDVLIISARKHDGLEARVNTLGKALQEEDARLAKIGKAQGEFDRAVKRLTDQVDALSLREGASATLSRSKGEKVPAQMSEKDKKAVEALRNQQTTQGLSITALKKRVQEQEKHIEALGKKIEEQDERIATQEEHMREQDRKIEEQGKQIEILMDMFKRLSLSAVDKVSQRVDGLQESFLKARDEMNARLETLRGIITKTNEMMQQLVPFLAGATDVLQQMGGRLWPQADFSDTQEEMSEESMQLFCSDSPLSKKSEAIACVASHKIEIVEPALWYLPSDYVRFFYGQVTSPYNCIMPWKQFFSYMSGAMDVYSVAVKQRKPLPMLEWKKKTTSSLSPERKSELLASFEQVIDEELPAVLQRVNLEGKMEEKCVDLFDSRMAQDTLRFLLKQNPALKQMHAAIDWENADQAQKYIEIVKSKILEHGIDKLELQERLKQRRHNILGKFGMKLSPRLAMVVVKLNEEIRALEQAMETAGNGESADDEYEEEICSCCGKKVIVKCKRKLVELTKEDLARYAQVVATPEMFVNLCDPITQSTALQLVHSETFPAKEYVEPEGERRKLIVSKVKEHILSSLGEGGREATIAALRERYDERKKEYQSSKTRNKELKAELKKSMEKLNSEIFAMDPKRAYINPWTGRKIK